MTEATDPTVTAALRAIVGAEHVHEHATLAGLTTFRVGGPADYLVVVRTADELRGVLQVAGQAQLKTTMLGGGSNVLISDRGVRGIVIRARLMDIEQSDRNAVRAGAGVTMNGLVRWTIGRGLSALESWAGTPGTVGGAIYGNAHYGGRNIGDLVTRVGLLTSSGELTEVPAAGMQFAYDTSRLQSSREVLVWAEFSVAAGDAQQLREVARGSLAYRKRTQPLDMPSAGCVFQNPDPRRDRVPAGIPFSAGALVDRAGLKGHRIGGAMISATHGNFIVNDGDATAADIHALIETARARVRDMFAVGLRDEVVKIGEF